MKKTLTTIEDFLNLLEITVNSKYSGTDKKLIEGDEKLEKEKNLMIKNIEDTIHELMAKEGKIYNRKYTHLYSKI
ncbi:MAG: hypothetical protein WDA02_06670 [Saccharofermentanales bacterium]|jgi:hypothetical protein